jgi:hypothetical protein
MMNRWTILAVAGVIAMNVVAAIRANDGLNDEQAPSLDPARKAGAAKEMRVERRQVTGTVAEIDLKQQTLTVAPSSEQQSQTQVAVQKHKPAKHYSLDLQISQRAEVTSVTRRSSPSGRSPGKTSARGTEKSKAETLASTDVQLCVGQMVSVVYEQHFASETTVGAKSAASSSAEARTPLLAVRIQVLREPFDDHD